MIALRPTPYHRQLTFLSAAVAAFCSDSAFAAGNPIEMSVTCRERAARTFKVRMPDVEAKYEGQRVDGMQPVNGTAYVGGKARNFQCLIAAAARRFDSAPQNSGCFWTITSFESDNGWRHGLMMPCLLRWDGGAGE